MPQDWWTKRNTLVLDTVLARDAERHWAFA